MSMSILEAVAHIRRELNGMKHTAERNNAFLRLERLDDAVRRLPANRELLPKPEYRVIIFAIDEDTGAKEVWDICETTDRHHLQNWVLGRLQVNGPAMYSILWAVRKYEGGSYEELGV